MKRRISTSFWGREERALCSVDLTVRFPVDTAEHFLGVRFLVMYSHPCKMSVHCHFFVTSLLSLTEISMQKLKKISITF